MERPTSRKQREKWATRQCRCPGVFFGIVRRERPLAIRCAMTNSLLTELLGSSPILSNELHTSVDDHETLIHSGLPTRLH